MTSAVYSYKVDQVSDCDALIEGMHRCADAWWGGIGTADDTDWRKLLEIAYRIRARASLTASTNATGDESR